LLFGLLNHMITDQLSQAQRTKRVEHGRPTHTFELLVEKKEFWLFYQQFIDQHSFKHIYKLMNKLYQQFFICITVLI